MIEWLPNELSINGNNINETYRMLFECFKRDFIDYTPQFHGKGVTFQHAIDVALPGNYPHGFTHLVTKKNGLLRVLDDKRATKLPWIRSIIEHCDDESVVVYDKVEASKRYGIVQNTYLWLENKKFLVILRLIEEGELEGRLLTTSFFVDEYKEKELLKDRQRILGY